MLGSLFITVKNFLRGGKRWKYPLEHDNCIVRRLGALAIVDDYSRKRPAIDVET
jgi:hypothetical protein